MKDWRIVQALYLALAYVVGTLEDRKEYRLIWSRGVFCQKPRCNRVGQYWVEVDGQHWHCCRNHADELMDLMAGEFTKAFREIDARERRGEFLQPDTNRGFAVYKSRGTMGPSIPIIK